jgi:hypothetical protein
MNVLIRLPVVFEFEQAPRVFCHLYIDLWILLAAVIFFCGMAYASVSRPSEISVRLGRRMVLAIFSVTFLRQFWSSEKRNKADTVTLVTRVCKVSWRFKRQKNCRKQKVMKLLS